MLDRAGEKLLNGLKQGGKPFDITEQKNGLTSFSDFRNREKDFRGRSLRSQYYNYLSIIVTELVRCDVGERKSGKESNDDKLAEIGRRLHSVARNSDPSEKVIKEIAKLVKDLPGKIKDGDKGGAKVLKSNWHNVFKDQSLDILNKELPAAAKQSDPIEALSQVVADHKESIDKLEETLKELRSPDIANERPFEIEISIGDPRSDRKIVLFQYSGGGSPDGKAKGK